MYKLPFSLSARGRVLLARVQDRDNLDEGRLDVVDDHVIRMDHDFPRAGDSARAVQVRMLGQLGSSALDVVSQVKSRKLVAVSDVFDDGGQVVTCLVNPLYGKHWYSRKTVESGIDPVIYSGVTTMNSTQQFS
jgi:hypothetical protein